MKNIILGIILGYFILNILVLVGVFITQWQSRKEWKILGLLKVFLFGFFIIYIDVFDLF